ncbi:MAG TPA: hypothetical protein VM389_07270 [Phycisphaerae bacterium]|nr:hypothetical protein [Phycisphaerae bacterium]
MNRGRTAGIAAAVVIAAAATALRADEIWVGKLPYSGVTIVGCSDGNVVFDMAGRQVTKPLAEVTKVVISDAPVLNSAETLFAAGKYKEAVKVYQQYLRTDPRGWKAALALHRKTQAESTPVSAAPPSADPAAKAAPARTTRLTCPYCRGGGWVACEQCKVGRYSTGKDKCLTCDGTGWTVCPDCHGDWEALRCNSCGGDGKITTRRTEGLFVRTISRTCTDCGGTGYCRTCCGNRSRRGKVPCKTCGGRGRDGTCPACAGLKKTPCPHCDPGAVKAEAAHAEDAAAAATDKGTPELEEVLKSTPPEPDTSGMTSLQVELARVEHKKKCEQIRRSLLGRKVTWTLEVIDVVRGAPAEESDLFPAGTITIVARGDSGFPVYLTFPASKIEELATYRMGHLVRVSGQVSRWLQLQPEIPQTPLHTPPYARPVSPSGRPAPPFARPPSHPVTSPPAPEPVPALAVDGSDIKPAPDARGPLWVSAGAEQVVYIVDGRSAARTRYADMRRAVARSIAELSDKQIFQVSLWGPSGAGSTGPMVGASASGKEKAIRSLERFRPSGTGDGGLGQFVERHLRPSYRSGFPKAVKTVCLVVGADLPNPEGLEAALKRYPWRGGVQVLTVQFGKLSAETEKLLEQAAATRGGRYRKLP